MPFDTDTSRTAEQNRDPALSEAYRRCRDLHAAHGKTYYLASKLLTPAQRPGIHALYGFARWVDDIVDDLDPRRSTGSRAAEIDALERVLLTGLRAGLVRHPVLSAVVDTARRYDLKERLFRAFLASMRMDLHTTDYPTRAELESYVHGSAEVIGLQVLPVLGTSVPDEEAAPYAAALGRAFQLTNFLRDVGEDLQRGRVYFPSDELAAFDVDRERLLWCHRRGAPDRAVRRALADQTARIRAVYRAAEPGVALLAPVSRPCVHTALILYGEIVDRVVESGYDVFRRRVSVPTARRSEVALRGATSAATARARARLRG
ncbi:phytoene/squalene synthase family protein [Allosaccharopolyspora coralli]|uniref:Phytoene/squalene synthase family protein n=1 Tax=Allosaccharopolyspora coralli TaxID=2665642 RepID=A0A5Q3Q656_9PSEU|nr:phytoene/squalene synthase family protein [Allosaccharopolyspora coralli]QGK70078.1 phytoene/squalene synthase family protein [Allosaccharopolyspora coralli]